jgi:hypothetical protein
MNDGRAEHGNMSTLGQATAVNSSCTIRVVKADAH